MNISPIVFSEFVNLVSHNTIDDLYVHVLSCDVWPFILKANSSFDLGSFNGHSQFKKEEEYIESLFFLISSN